MKSIAENPEFYGVEAMEKVFPLPPRLVKSRNGQMHSRSRYQFTSMYMCTAAIYKTVMPKLDQCPRLNIFFVRKSQEL